MESSELKFDIGHVLFIDIVGYSKLLIAEQSNQIQTLREIVRGTEQFKKADAEGKLLRLPTGDGGALVFRNTLEAPVLCALEISKALKSHPELKVRMGIHSGPVNEIRDLNEQANIAGVGINMAQRVMDCGDAGHILLSKRVADDLEQYPQWCSHLTDLGECEVKHGTRVSVVNLYTDEVGNAEAPAKFQKTKVTQPAPAAAVTGATPARRSRTLIAALIIVAALAAAAGFYISSHRAGPKVAPPSAGPDRLPAPILETETPSPTPGADRNLTIIQSGSREAGPTTLKFASIEPATDGTWQRSQDIEEFIRHRQEPPDEHLTSWISKACIENLLIASAFFWEPAEKQNSEGVEAVGEPVFDVTISNVSDEPAVITGVGFELLMAGLLHPTWGEGFKPYEIPVFKDFQVRFPQIRLTGVKLEDKQIWQRYVWDFRAKPQLAYVKCKNPIALPAKQTLRYRLQIKDFVWAKESDDGLAPAPNHAVIRLVVLGGDAGVAKSEPIYLNTVQ
jgi:hypothetical protein